ncbi:MAG: HAD hydrolase-like protein [Pseudomonadota bacterium]
MTADRLAVFDLDGTLIDTAPDLIDTANIVLKAHGFDPVPNSVLRDFIGVGARKMIASGLKANGAGVDQVEMDRAHADFIAHYETRMARHSRPFPEIIACLDALDAAGVPMAVCTNKQERLARQLLSELGLMDRFVALTGGNTFSVAKPHPDHLWNTIDLAKGQRAGTVFIGDSRIDFETARAAKIPFVGLDYGYTDVPMAELGPDRLCSPGEDIAAAILSLFPAPVRR